MTSFTVNYEGFILHIEEVFDFEGGHLRKYKAYCKEVDYKLYWDTTDLNVIVNEFQEKVNNHLAKRKKEIEELLIRGVYKESVETKEYVRIGNLKEDSTIEFYKRSTCNESSSKVSAYHRGFYKFHTTEPNYRKFTPKNKIVEIPTLTGTPNLEELGRDTCCVTGWVTEDGKVIYYDQYL